jgi:sugar lactone lactonase YvrE
VNTDTGGVRVLQRQGREPIMICGPSGVGRLGRLVALLAAVLGSVLLLPAASAIAAPSVEPVRPRGVKALKSPGVDVGEPPTVQVAELAKGKAAEGRALAIANKRHGLPPGVAAPKWALQPGQHPFFTPAPNDLRRSKTRPGTTATRGQRDEEAANVGRARPRVFPGDSLEEPLRQQGPNNHLESREGETPPLAYLGGVVQHEPKIDVVFWGSHWNETPGAALRTQLTTFYNGLSSSAEQGILTQYFDPNGRISSTTAPVASMIDTRVTAPTNVNIESITNEVKYAESILGAHNSETQYEILTAPGSTYESAFVGHFCAFHNVDSDGAVYSFVPYEGDEPFKTGHLCEYYGSGNAANATNVMASHEYAEAATDPLWDTQPSWQDLETEEIGDLCATPGDKLPNGSWVQGWYDDHQNACSESDASPPHVLALTGAATHVTRQEATLNATVNPESLETTYQFEYGLTEAYGTKVPTTEVSLGAGGANVSVHQQLSGLELEKAYHYRVVAKNSNGTTVGEDRTFIPSRWGVQLAPTEQGWGENWLNGVSCAAGDSCMGVGYYYNSATAPNNRALSYQLTGGQWVPRPIPQAESERLPYLTGISCSARAACTAVGRVELNGSGQYSALAERWNGAAWTRQEVPLPGNSIEAELFGVTCMTETECLAVGTVETSAKVWVSFSALWSHGNWASVAIPTSPESTLSEVRAVSCGSKTSCLAVGWYNTGSGSRPFSLLWANGAWTLQSRSIHGDFEGVACPSTEFCMAVGGEDGTPLAEIWNGTSWTKSTTAKVTDVSGGYFNGVSCISATACTVVGAGYSKVHEAHESSVTLAEAWNGTSWTEQTTPRESERARNELEGVSCAGVTGCIAVGASRATGHWATLIESHHSEAVSAAYLSAFGSEGTAKGQFKLPVGLATDAAGNLWAADTTNNRVEEFNAKGEFVLTFGWEVNKTKVESNGSQAEKNLCTAASGNVCQAGKAGSNVGQLSEPLGLAFTSSGNLWVTERGNNRVQEFTTKGESLARFGSEGTGNGQFSEPWGIAIAATGSIWVSDARFYRVEEFSASGQYIRQQHGASWGGAGNGEFWHPTGISISGDGNVWVVDCRNNRLQQLSPAGEYISQFGTKGAGEAQYNEPTAIAIREGGDLLVADTLNNRVEETTQAGEYVTQYGTAGGGSGQFSLPEGIAVGRGGVEYVADTGNRRVQRWSQPAVAEATSQPASAVKATELTLKGTVNPGGSATTYRFEYGTTSSYGTSVPAPGESAGSGTDAVSESRIIANLQPETTYHFRIVAANTYGTSYGQDAYATTPPAFEFSFGGSGSTGGKLAYPGGAATDSTGNVWVADQENNRISEFTALGEFVLVFGREVNKTKVETGGSEAEKNLCTASSGNVCQAGKAGSANGQLSLPRDVAFTANGNLWVTEIGNDRVQEFNTKGEYLAKFGAEGTGSGQFSEPAGIAIATNGNIWVSDARYYRVEEFTANGAFILAVGAVSAGGNGATEFWHPTGLAIDASGNIWVADTRNNRVQELYATGSYRYRFGVAGSGEGQMGEPVGIAIKPSGNLLIVEEGTSRGQMFAPSGEYLTHFATEGIPGDIALGPGGVEYVTGSTSGVVEKLGSPTAPEATTSEASAVTGTEVTTKGTVNPGGAATNYYFEYGPTTGYGTRTSEVSAGSGWKNVSVSKTITGLATGVVYHFRLVASNRLGTANGKDATFTTVPVYSSAFGSEGAGNGQFKHAGDVAVDSKRNLWVLDKGNSRVQEFNEKGEYQKAFGSAGSGNGQLTTPSGLALDAAGNVWVIDTGNSRVEEFNEKGEYQKVFGSKGIGNGQFKTPEGIAVDPHGNLWVSDTANGRIQEFTEKGEFIRAAGTKGSGTGQMGEPEGLASDANGNVWIADWSNSRTEEFNEKGEYIKQFGTLGAGNGQLKNPYGIAVDTNGNVWVADNGNNRVDEFNEKGEYVSQFGTTGAGAGQFSFSWPIGLATDSQGDIWVTDPNNSRIEKWV